MADLNKPMTLSRLRKAIERRDLARGMYSGDAAFLRRNKHIVETDGGWLSELKVGSPKCTLDEPFFFSKKEYAPYL